MKKGLIISFTGSRGTEIPLLYYAAKHYENQGFEKLLVNCYMMQDSDFEITYDTIKKTVEVLNLEEYENIIFVAKSIGTFIACKLKDELNIPAKLILFTPIEETLPYIRRNNDIIIVAAGNQDRMLNSEKLVNICIAENVKYYIEDGVGHGMEVMNDLKKNLTVISNIISKL